MKLFFLLTLLILLTLADEARSQVNPREASLSKQVIDLTLPTPSGTFSLRRLYQSRSLHRGFFGYGWCSDLETSLQFTKDGDLSAKDGDFFLKDCRRSAPVRFRRNRATRIATTEDPGLGKIVLLKGFAVRIQPDGTKEKFDPQGRLVSRFTPGQGRLELLYDRAGKLSQLQIGRNTLRVNWVPSSTQIKEIVVKDFIKDVFKGTVNRGLAEASATISYEYTKDDLVGVQSNHTQHRSGQNIEVTKTTYGYDRFHNLTRIAAPNGNEVYTYDGEKDQIISSERQGCRETYEYRESHESHAPGDHSFVLLQRSCADQAPTSRRYDFWYRQQAGARVLQSIQITEGGQVRWLRRGERGLVAQGVADGIH